MEAKARPCPISFRWLEDGELTTGGIPEPGDLPCTGPTRPRFGPEMSVVILDPSQLGMALGGLRQPTVLRDTNADSLPSRGTSAALFPSLPR